MTIEYIRESVETLPENVRITIHRHGVHVEVFDHKSVYQKTFSWIDLEFSRINPIIHWHSNL